jgi:hypothetical protein
MNPSGRVRSCGLCELRSMPGCRDSTDQLRQPGFLFRDLPRIAPFSFGGSFPYDYKFTDQ